MLSFQGSGYHNREGLASPEKNVFEPVPDGMGGGESYLADAPIELHTDV